MILSLIRAILHPSSSHLIDVLASIGFVVLAVVVPLRSFYREANRVEAMVLDLLPPLDRMDGEAHAYRGLLGGPVDGERR